MVTELTRRAREYFETEDSEPTPSLVDYAVAWIEDGGTLVSLAREITTDALIEIRREMLSNYLNKTEGEEGAARLARARARGAHSIAERGYDALLTATDDDASKLAERANRAGQWLAERWNREELGKAPDTVVAISAHDLHLHALQRAPERPALPAASPEPVSVAPSDVPAEDVSIAPA